MSKRGAEGQLRRSLPRTSGPRNDGLPQTSGPRNDGGYWTLPFFAIVVLAIVWITARGRLGKYIELLFYSPPKQGAAAPADSGSGTGAKPLLDIPSRLFGIPLPNLPIPHAPLDVTRPGSSEPFQFVFPFTTPPTGNRQNPSGSPTTSELPGMIKRLFDSLPKLK